MSSDGEFAFLVGEKLLNRLKDRANHRQIGLLLFLGKGNGMSLSSKAHRVSEAKDMRVVVFGELVNAVSRL